ncbi:MAG TPA: hypothetical protein PK264_17805 [Hyphomicrobiaceae bacterium]|nr:hypothetical protein [Hyphomicrobiaceae bacterium]
MKKYNILMLGASYGSLLLLGGHSAHLICLPAEADLINKHGARVRIPVKGRDGLVEINTQKLTGRLSAGGPAGVDPSTYDLVCLGMQEPQYRSPGVRELMERIAKSKVPCMSIMNMPPLPYLARIPGLSLASLEPCFADASVWKPFDPTTMTLCSPDPQAFRPPEEPVNVLQVSLPTNFKAARFQSDAHTSILRQLQADIEGARVDVGDGPFELPVKLKVHDSIFVPLAKWAMLLTGNYRCVGKDGMRSIKEAVHTDVNASREVYTWVMALCRSLGAAAEDLVPFEKYAAAANGLVRPSSAARALAAGAQNIERVDMLVRNIAAQKGLKNPVVEETVALVDGWLAKNRAKSA